MLSKKLTLYLVVKDSEMDPPPQNNKFPQRPSLGLEADPAHTGFGYPDEMRSL